VALPPKKTRSKWEQNDRGVGHRVDAAAVNVSKSPIEGKVRSSAADYFQQAANLIFEEARGPVRIECNSDRDLPITGQKLAERCANAIHSG
jgi:hypothetical protein